MTNKVTPSVTPGSYPDAQTVSWTFDPLVTEVAYTINGLPPVLSEYIAYDSLDPPNPFIAVTQDGSGNVVYDGGFPKIYNSNAPAPGATFSTLPPSYKFMHNALNFIANPTKVATGNRNILILGDKAVSPYWAKGTDVSDFKTSFDRLAEAGSWTLTYKDSSDYAGTLNPSLSELENYVAVVLMSTLSGTTSILTDNAEIDLTTFRSNGNGILIITDHGPVVPNIASAYPLSAAGFFAAGNKLARNFGTYFSGDFNRTPVNVGYIRTNFGDHPLYNGLTNAEDIYAGASESRVVVTEYPTQAPGTVPDTLADSGNNTIRFLVKLSDSSIETYTFVYSIATGEIIEFLDSEGNPISGIDIGWDYRVDIGTSVLGTGLGTLLGSIYNNTKKVGELHFDETNGSTAIWYAGEALRVNNGDVIKAMIEQPFSYERALTVQRLQPDIYDVKGLAKIVQDVSGATPGTSRTRVINQALTEVGQFHSMVYGPSGAKNVQQLKKYLEGIIPYTDVNAYAYDATVDVTDALGRITPPTLQQIFNNWSRFDGDLWFPTGTTPTGDAAAWYWDNALGSAVQPNNTAAYTGFVSDYDVVNYEMDVTFQSSAADDDFISVVLAFVRDENTGFNHTLDFVVSGGAGGFGTRNPWPEQLVTIDFTDYLTWETQTARYREIQIVQGSSPALWNNRSKKVRVVREGDQFTIQASLFDGTAFDPSMTMMFNLNDTPELALFKGAKPFGFGTLSQGGTYFKDLTVSDGYRRDIILDMLNNLVYRYFNGQWQLATGVTVHDVLGAPRIINAIEGVKSYQLNTNGTISIV